MVVICHLLANILDKTIVEKCQYVLCKKIYLMFVCVNEDLHVNRDIYCITGEVPVYESKFVSAMNIHAVWSVFCTGIGRTLLLLNGIYG